MGPLIRGWGNGGGVSISESFGEKLFPFSAQYDVTGTDDSKNANVSAET